MDWIMDGMPLLKVSVAFLCMLLLIKKGVHLSLSILTGCVAMGLLFGMRPKAWGEAALAGVTGETTVYLALIVVTILVLSDVMSKTGQTERLMGVLAAYIRHPRLRLVFFPVLIGLLPMPGGAVFSAPMVESAALNMQIDERRKTLINYWFRHVWEISWPLYPGLILASSLAGVPITHIVAYAWIGMPLMVALGWFFFLRPGVLPLPPEAYETDETLVRRHGQLFRLGLPYLIAIVGALGLEMLIASAFPEWPFELGVVTALALSILCALLQNRVAPGMVFRLVFSGSVVKMIAIIISIFVFKEVLQRAGAVEELARMAGGDVALFASAVFLPFVVGVIAGINVAYVGAAFPLMLGLLRTMGMESQTMAYVMLALVVGFAGVMVSPMHICFVLTCQYFGESLARPWRRLVLPCTLLLLFGVGYWAALL